MFYIYISCNNCRMECFQCANEKSLLIASRDMIGRQSTIIMCRCGINTGSGTCTNTHGILRMAKQRSKFGSIHTHLELSCQELLFIKLEYEHASSHSSLHIPAYQPSQGTLHGMLKMGYIGFYSNRCVQTSSLFQL